MPPPRWGDNTFLAGKTFPFSNRPKPLASLSMYVFENPAWKAFHAQLGKEQVLGQVLIRRHGPAFELRHVGDRDLAAELLAPRAVTELRKFAQFTANGAFRPLKSAPTLPAGWRCAALTESALELALAHFHPGAVADWFAGLSADVPVTDYHPYTRRQTGMYRITQWLTDEKAAATARDVCAPAACLKRRLWRVAGLAPDAAAEKSVIPCSEPCAMLLEVARQTARAEQDAQRKASPKPAQSPENE